MPKQDKEKDKEKKHSKFYDFMNNPNTVFAVLVIITLLVMVLNVVIIKTHKLYTFGGYDDDISVDSGTIDINFDINYFRGGNIIYNGKDYKVKSYTMGYYICDGNKKTKLITSSNTSDEEVSLKNLLQSENFSITESHSRSKVISKSKLKNINDLCFVVDAKTDKNKKIDLKVKLDVTKLSK